MMNILISVNNNYLDKAETMLHSLRRNNSEDVTVYLMNHSLAQNKIKKFKNYVTTGLKMQLEVIEISKTAFDQLPVNGFSIEIYYRVIAQFLLPKTVDRIMWLDADIMICKMINEFYYQDFEGKLLVACPDINYEKEEILQIKRNLGLSAEHAYFNSGVLLMNVEALRAKTTFQEIIETANSIAQHLVYPDQDLLNYLYSGRVKYCDQNKYNCQVNGFGELTQAQREEICILHYAGPLKPWRCYYIHDLAEAAVPYWKEVMLQGKWLSVMKIMVLYGLWMVYYKTGVCHIARKVMCKKT